MADFDISGHSYRSGKINGKMQFKLAKKIAPVMVIMMRLAKGGADMFDLMEPLAQAVADMPDENSDLLFDTCMKVTSRKVPGGANYAPIWNEGAERTMYEDIDLAVELKIIAEVLKDNFSSFFIAFQQG